MEMIIELKFIDPWMWKKFKSDKPWSTGIWLIMVVLVGLFVEHVLIFSWMLSYVALMMAVRFSTFNYLYNWIFAKPWDYLGLDYWDRWKNSLGIYFRIVLEIFILLVGVMQFLYFGCVIYNDPGINIIFNLPRFCT